MRWLRRRLLGSPSADIERVAHREIADGIVAGMRLAARRILADQHGSRSMTYTADRIARVCHEANRALQLIHGDPAPSPAWDNAPDWQRESAIEGVAAALRGATPEQLHEAWCETKRRDGWTYGPVKDADAKTHPCLVPYAELPAEQLAPPPFLNEPVHYVAYGTPGGEYPSTCRAAVVTAVGAWVTDSISDTYVDEFGPTRRTVGQRYDPDAVALCVTNPTGLFLNERVQYHSGRSVEGSADPISGVFPGGTWHRASDCYRADS